MTNQREHSLLNLFRDIERSFDLELRLLVKLCLWRGWRVYSEAIAQLFTEYLLPCGKAIIYLFT